MLPDCYSREHTGALNKIAGRVPEAREFMLSYDRSLGTAGNVRLAAANRWFGNINEAYVSRLLLHLEWRFQAGKPLFGLLQTYFRSGFNHGEFQWCNHLFMLLQDPYYRWAASVYLPERLAMGLPEIVKDPFYRDLQAQLPAGMGILTARKYGQNCLTALGENGLLKGKVKKLVSSPALPVNALALMLYVLADLGAGGNAFDGSPLFLSLLKDRTMLVPVLLDGERLQYWDFTGDRNRLALNLRNTGLAHWMEHKTA